MQIRFLLRYINPAAAATVVVVVVVTCHGQFTCSPSYWIHRSGVNHISKRSVLYQE